MFDFYKEFLGIDIAKAEMISELIGKFTAILYRSMIDNGLDDQTARAILRDAEVSIFSTIMSGK